MPRKKPPESTFQQHIADFLVREHKYPVLEQAEISDTEHCIAEDHLWAFLRATQRDTLDKLAADYGTDARDEVFKALRADLRLTPLWVLIRHGLKVRGLEFRLFYPKPRSSEKAKATLILSAIEFARRRIKPEGVKITTPADVLPLIRHFADRKKEHFLTVTINGANEVLNVRVVSIGLVDRSHVHPREVFADVIADRASGIIVAHNHPAGSLEPSPADVVVTQQIKQAGEIVGIQLLDHIIFNRSGYFSFLESGRL